MRDDDDGTPVLVREIAQQLPDALATLGVERGRGLVGEKDSGIARERPRDRDALSLAAAQFMGKGLGAMGDAHALQELEAAALARRAARPRSSKATATFSHARRFRNRL